MGAAAGCGWGGIRRAEYRNGESAVAAAILRRAAAIAAFGTRAVLREAIRERIGGNGL